MPVNDAHTVLPRWVLPAIKSNFSLDPVSLITLFLDSSEKELMHRSGDLNFLSFFGLFANPTTAWLEYGSLFPGQGIRYYNPQRRLTSTVEVARVNDYLIRLSGRRRNAGLVVDLSLAKHSFSWSIEWMVIRPLILIAIIFVAAASRDFVGVGALIALLVGQSIVIGKSIWDGKPKVIDNNAEERNVFFLANNVTLIVKSHGNLFVNACSSLYYKKIERPLFFEACATTTFMIGVLLVGAAGLNFKVAYLAGHGIQAALLALHSKRTICTQILNRVTWDVRQVITLKQRRDAYVWVTKETTGNLDWLSMGQLANDEVMKYVQEKLVVAAEQ